MLASFIGEKTFRQGLTNYLKSRFGDAVPYANFLFFSKAEREVHDPFGA